jgi:hypothetical protein
MAAAASSTTIPLGLYQVVVTVAQNTVCECPPPDLSLSQASDMTTAMLAGDTSKYFTFMRACSAMIGAKNEAYPDLFKKLVLDKVNATYYPYLLNAAVRSGDNVEMVQLVLNTAKDIPNLGPIKPEVLISLAQKESKAKVEAFLRKHYNLPVVAVSSAAAAPTATATATAAPTATVAPTVTATATAAAPQETLSAEERQCLEEGAKVIRALLVSHKVEN